MLIEEVFEDGAFSQMQLGNGADWQPSNPYSEEAPEELGFSCFYPSYSTGVLLIEWKNRISFRMSPKGLSPQLTWSPSRRSLPKIENRHHLFSTRERREEWALVRSSLTMKFNSNPSGNGLACMIQVSIEDCRTFPFFMLSLKYPRFGRYVLMLIITCTK